MLFITLNLSLDNYVLPSGHCLPLTKPNLPPIRPNLLPIRPNILPSRTIFLPSMFPLSRPNIPSFLLIRPISYFTLAPPRHLLYFIYLWF